MEKKSFGHLQLDCGVGHNIGSRKEQQDFFATFNHLGTNIVESPGGFLSVVADGMGGHVGGAKASDIAVNHFVEEYKKVSAHEPPLVALKKSLIKANRAVAAENQKLDTGEMGTTLCACVLKFNKLYWVSAGDSEILRLRDGVVQRINEDHTYGAELDHKLQLGEISITKANSENRKRNQLTSFLGLDVIPKIDLPNVPLDFQPGDQVILCSDGLTNTMDYQEIAASLLERGSDQQKCDRLIEKVLKKGRPKQDNITLVLFSFSQEKPTSTTVGDAVLSEAIDGRSRARSATSFSDSSKGQIFGLAVFLFLVMSLGAYYYFIVNDGSGGDSQAPMQVSSIKDKGGSHPEDKTDNAFLSKPPSSLGQEGDASSQHTPQEEYDQGSEGGEKVERISEVCEISIAEAQRILSINDLYPKDKIDGNAGPPGSNTKTRRAILDFQINNYLNERGLSDSSEILPETCKKLREIERQLKNEASLLPATVQESFSALEIEADKQKVVV